MAGVLPALIAVLGTLIGVAMTHLFQHRAAVHDQLFSPRQQLRAEHMAVYSDFAGPWRSSDAAGRTAGCGGKAGAPVPFTSSWEPGKPREKGLPQLLATAPELSRRMTMTGRGRAASLPPVRSENVCGSTGYLAGRVTVPRMGQWSDVLVSVPIVQPLQVALVGAKM